MFYLEVEADFVFKFNVSKVAGINVARDSTKKEKRKIQSFTWNSLNCVSFQISLFQNL